MYLKEKEIPRADIQNIWGKFEIWHIFNKFPYGPIVKIDYFWDDPLKIFLSKNN